MSHPARVNKSIRSILHERSSGETVLVEEDLDFILEIAQAIYEELYRPDTLYKQACQFKNNIHNIF